jgi:hypothetical protein
MKTLCCFLLTVSALCLGVLIPTRNCAAQTSVGVITGRIVDAQGSSVPGASVLLTQDETGAKLTSKTETSGDFVFLSVPPGTYRIDVEAKGFKQLEQKGLTLTALERISVGSLALEVGSLTESVTVTSDAALLNTASSEGSALLNKKQMEGLPDQGRSSPTC